MSNHKIWVKHSKTVICDVLCSGRQSRCDFNTKTRLKSRPLYRWIRCWLIEVSSTRGRVKLAIASLSSHGRNPAHVPCAGEQCNTLTLSDFCISIIERAVNAWLPQASYPMLSLWTRTVGSGAMRCSMCWFPPLTPQGTEDEDCDCMRLPWKWRTTRYRWWPTPAT